MSEREFMAAVVAEQIGDQLVVFGWFGVLGVAIVGGVAYLRARR